MLAVLTVPAAIGMTLALTAGTASAGTVPGVPSGSQMSMHGHDRFQRQTFTVTVTDDNPGVVTADGPVMGTGTDIESSTNPTQAVFDFGDGNTVNVLHTDVSNVQPTIDLRSCTATVVAFGSWLFDGGTGTYKRVFGFGHFRFFLFAVFKKHHHHCKITEKTQPKHVFIIVKAWGKATLGKHRHHHD
jgi:hypothetical protein